MSFNIGKLNKLRGMRLSEFMGRTQQELVKRADRIFIASMGEMSDEALYREFIPAARNGSGEGTVEILRDRLRIGEGLFLPTLNERKAIVEIMDRRFPSERDAIITNAEKAAQGKLDLLGYTDLDFGHPIDWHLDPLSGDRAPLIHWSKIDPVVPLGKGDLKVFWEIQRTAHFVTFGQAYWLTGDHRYAEEFVNQALSWIDENPSGMGIGWSASLDVSFRTIAWIWALQLCADSRELTTSVVARIIKSLIEHGCHIEKYLSYYFSPNTHLTGEALGLFYLGVVFPELRRAKKWRNLGLKILIEQLTKHVRRDGVYFEQASYYHRYTTDFYTHLFAIVRANGITLPREDEQLLWRKLDLLYNHLMWIGRPDSTWPLFGDDDGGRLIKFAPRVSNDFRDTLATGTAIFKRGDLKWVAGDAPVEMLWLLGPEAINCYDHVRAEAPQDSSHAFETSGYFVMRDGWEKDSSYCLIDCGRHGAELGSGHAHSDALATEIAIRGTTWLIDPATYIYAAEPIMRDWFRSTRAHNTAMVDGKDQSVMAGPFAWETMASCNLIEFSDRGESVVFTGSHDGYQRLSDPVTHVRSVLMLRRKGVFIISDKFIANAQHNYMIRFHLAPGCEANAFDYRAEASMPSGETLVLNFFVKGQGLNGLRTRIEGGWVSTCYGQQSEAPIAVFEASGDGPIEFTTIILATSLKEIES